MNSKFTYPFLVAAMSSALCSTPVMAEDVMKFYGQANISLDNSDAKGPGRTEGTELKSNASRFGLKGSLDTTLANTSLIYQLEAEYKTVGENGDAATDPNQIYVREAYTGLNNKQFGKFRMGRLTTGYKSSYTKIDPWTDHVLQARQSGQQGASNLNSNYFNYAVEYVTPKFNGIQLNAHYSFLSDANTSALHNSGKLAAMEGGSASGFGVKYSKDGLRLTADYMNLESDNNPGATSATAARNGSSMQFTVQYKLGSGTTLAGLYEDATDINLGENIFAIVSQKIGKNGLLTASYGVNKASSDNAYSQTEDASTIGLGGKYMLTKKSAFVLGWSRYERGVEEVSTFTVGIDAKFGY
ncbi:porin [Thiomicrorhabdus sp. 6S2-11]|uniref:Porin n=1 Tax=Thiomicrorhabdus marina TaxID=2818442 RepID=A0ABS3Q4L7_9GAMM|nr:porin [Thiomicrorhabdus marina]MBO1927259.1 porin [Thiomicrorhabdus marina]